jgi:hypothetical protein
MIVAVAAGCTSDEATELSGEELDESEQSATILVTNGDAYVRSGAYAGTNYGSLPSLQATTNAGDGTAMRSYLKFTTGPAAIARARLKLYVTNGTVGPIDVYRAGNTWTQAGITWNNKPALDATKLASIGSVGGSRWVYVDVTAAVSPSSTVSFALVPQTADNLIVNSKEAASYRPQLVIDAAGAHESDGTPANIQAIHDSASTVDGDTIMIPAGTFTWTTGVSITKRITLKGRGVGVSIIRDNVDGAQLLVFRDGSRITGIEFADGGRTPYAVAPAGAIKGNGAGWRVDHCKFDHVQGQFVSENGLGSVIDHNDFHFTGTGYIAVYNSNYGGRSYGEGSAIAPSNFGTNDFVFIEDNDLRHDNSSYAAVDAFAGARYVLRYNMMYNSRQGGHGTEGQRSRGVRAVENYGNTHINTEVGLIANIRGGVQLIYDNHVQSGPISEWAISAHSHRMFQRSPIWGGADGKNGIDQNVAGGPFLSGTAAAASSGLSVRVTGANWTENRWAGYSLIRTTNVGGLNEACSKFSFVKSNDANTLYFSGNGGYTCDLAFSAQDALQLWKVDHVIDQPGRSGGSIFTTSPPQPLPGGNDQVTEPCYIWNNTDSSGNPIRVAATTPNVRMGEHIKQIPMPGYTPYPHPHPLASVP